MRIAIISDIHDNLVNLEKCLTWCVNNNIEYLICCGDVTNSETLEFLAHFNKSVGNQWYIYLVKGNMEIFEDKEVEKYKNVKFLGRVGRFNLEGKNIGLCHEPFLIKKVKELGKCDIIFYGHTHKPWLSFAKATESKENIESDTKLINPGTLGGVFQKATFAVWDSGSGELELKILEIL